jgi:LysM repeat protein/uncharacterized protein YvpB
MCIKYQIYVYATRLPDYMLVLYKRIQTAWHLSCNWVMDDLSCLNCLPENIKSARIINMTKMLRIFMPFARIMILMTLLLTGFSYPGRAQELPEAAYVSGVVGHAQRFVLSCESRSAADWAAYWGVHIDESDFLMNLPRSDNPDAGFVGNANDAWGYVPPYSYGVHADPVAELLQEYGLRADAQRGLQWDDLRAEIAAGRPVIVWIIGQMWPGSPRSYTASDGHTTTVASFEHTMILTGYNASSVQIVDASSGWTQTYPLGSFLASWSTLDNMAVTGFLEDGHQPATSPAAGEGYTVQHGDYLMALARRFNTTWTELAALNKLTYPYTIHPGQIILLPGSPEKAQAPQEDQAPPPVMTPSAPSEAITAEWIVHLPVIYRTQPVIKPAKVEKDEPALPETYIVQPGEYLVELAQRFGYDWQELAELNGIIYPYVIYPGQQLRLP